MEQTKSGDAGLTLRLAPCNGKSTSVHCDSVRLVAKDGAGGTGGGSLGIRRGHARALVALAAGPVQARLGGETVYEIELSGGIAFVEHDTVTVFPD